jgi:hypothetical protein
MMWILPLLFTTATAASFGSYYDANCSVPITNALTFTDVCTWSSNQYSGSWSLFLESCSDKELNAVVFNASDAPTCVGVPVYKVKMTEECTKFEDAYVKALDFTCNSQNNTYNVLAHFQPDCKDGGVPFSVQLGEGTCQPGSFAPGFFNWDTQGSYSAPYYQMEVYNTTDGECKIPRASFQTESFPAACVPASNPFEVNAVDIYEAFPTNP